MMRETSPAALQSRWHPCHPIPILLPLIHPHHQVQTLLPSLLPSVDPPAPTKAYSHPDEDPKLQLGSRPPTKKPSTPAMQQDTLTSGGASADTTNTSGT